MAACFTCNIVHIRQLIYFDHYVRYRPTSLMHYF